MQAFHTRRWVYWCIIFFCNSFPGTNWDTSGHPGLQVVAKLFKLFLAIESCFCDILMSPFWLQEIWLSLIFSFCIIRKYFLNFKIILINLIVLINKWQKCFAQQSTSINLKSKIVKYDNIPIKILIKISCFSSVGLDYLFEDSKENTCNYILF